MKEIKIVNTKIFERVATSFLESLEEIEEESTKKELEQLFDNTRNNIKSDISKYVIESSSLYLNLAKQLAKNNITAAIEISEKTTISYNDFDMPGVLAFVGTLEATDYMIDKLKERKIKNGDNLIENILEIAEEDFKKVVDHSDDLEESLKEARQVSYRLLIDLILSFK